MSSASAILLGYLDDLSSPGVDGHRRLVELSMELQRRAGRLDVDVELLHRRVNGLPRGSAGAVADAFLELTSEGVVAIVGPAITDNVLAIRSIADQRGVPTLAWPGGEECRSEYVFQYQAGSLEDEPHVIARHLASSSLHDVVLVHDLAATGVRMAANFEAASAAVGVRIVSRFGVSQLDAPLPDVLFDEITASSASALVHLGLFGIRPLSLGLAARHIDLPVVSNIVASMAQNDPTWLAPLEGWAYVDMVSDSNTVLASARQHLFDGHPLGPSLVSGLDIGRLLAEALVQAASLTRDGVMAGFERVKYLPSAAGREGTRMGFGPYDRAALKGDYLVLRRYVDGVSTELR